MSRTVSRRDWRVATEGNPCLAGQVSEAVTGIMAKLYLDYPSEIDVSYDPWPNHGLGLRGFMWIGVPNVVSCWKDDEGCWILSTRESRDSPDGAYLRLSPSLPEHEVQYGYCPIKVSLLEELIRKELSKEEERVAKKMILSYSRTTGFRVDRMTTSVLSLSNPKDTTVAGQRFRELLGKTSPAMLVEDFFRGLYNDSQATQDVMKDRDSAYGAMIYLAANRAYPNLMSPSNLEDISRLQTILGKTGDLRWASEYVWPYYRNIVMPQVLFEAVSKNLEKEIPPLVPQYLTRGSWIFNGSYYDPCTGLTGNIPSSIIGNKVIAGVVNRFNLDLPGRISYWPADMNPPGEWLAKAVECAEALYEAELPLSLIDRQDFVLQETRKIPVVQQFIHSRVPCGKFSLITALDMDNGNVSKLEIGECNASGQLLSESEITASTSSSEQACYNCSEIITVGDAGASTCRGCGNILCESCRNESRLCRQCEERGYDGP